MINNEKSYDNKGKEFRISKNIPKEYMRKLEIIEKESLLSLGKIKINIEAHLKDGFNENEIKRAVDRYKNIELDKIGKNSSFLSDEIVRKNTEYYIIKVVYKDENNLEEVLNLIEQHTLDKEMEIEVCLE